MKYSRKIENWFDGHENLIGKLCDSSCSSGCDNDGSTSLEIFENGMDFGRTLDKDDKLFYFINDDVAYIFADTSEDNLVQRFDNWLKENQK